MTNLKHSTQLQNSARSMQDNIQQLLSKVATALIVKCYTIPQFCEAHNLSKAKFYELKKEGKAPRIMKVGNKNLISTETATDWRRDMEVDNG